MVTLANPSAEESLTTHVGKEAFITALSDDNLQLEVIKWEHPTVEAAYEQSLACQGTSATEHDVGCAKRRSRNVYAVTDQSDSSKTATLWKQVEELQEALEQVTKGIAAQAAGPWSGRAPQLGAAATVCLLYTSDAADE